MAGSAQSELRGGDGDGGVTVLPSSSYSVGMRTRKEKKIKHKQENDDSVKREVKPYMMESARRHTHMEIVGWRDGWGKGGVGGNGVSHARVASPYGIRWPQYSHTREVAATGASLSLRSVRHHGQEHGKGALHNPECVCVCVCVCERERERESLFRLLGHVQAGHRLTDVIRAHTTQLQLVLHRGSEGQEVRRVHETTRLQQCNSQDSRPPHGGRRRTLLGPSCCAMMIECAQIVVVVHRFKAIPLHPVLPIVFFSLARNYFKRWTWPTRSYPNLGLGQDGEEDTLHPCLTPASSLVGPTLMCSTAFYSRSIALLHHQGGRWSHHSTRGKVKV